MGTSGLKARDIEALAYLQGSRQAGSRPRRERRGVRVPPAIAAGATAIVLAAAAFAWVLLRG